MLQADVRTVYGLCASPLSPTVAVGAHIWTPKYMSMQSWYVYAQEQVEPGLRPGVVFQTPPLPSAPLCSYPPGGLGIPSTLNPGPLLLSWLPVPAGAVLSLS